MPVQDSSLGPQWQRSTILDSRRQGDQMLHKALQIEEEKGAGGQWKSSDGKIFDKFEIPGLLPVRYLGGGGQGKAVRVMLFIHGYMLEQF